MRLCNDCDFQTNQMGLGVYTGGRQHWQVCWLYMTVTPDNRMQELPGSK